MYTRVTTTRKDGSARQDRLYLTRSIILVQLRNNAEQCSVCPKQPPTFYCSRAVAGCNDEVRKTDASHCERTTDPPSS